MTVSSIYELSKKVEKSVLEEEVSKRKASQMAISFDEYWFSYDFSLMDLQSKIHQNVIELNDLYFGLSDFEKEYLLRDAAINEILISSLDRRYPLSSKNTFSYWIYSSENANSSLIDCYKTIIKKEFKFPKEISDLKRIYDLLIRPLNSAYHLKNIKKYHYFRTDELTVGLKSNLFPLENGTNGEQNIIEEMNTCLNFLNVSPFDQYTRAAIFFFLFMNSMPFYNENFFICKFVISLFLQHSIRNDLLALSIGEILDSYRDLLISTFAETKSKGNHGDLSHFAKTFLRIVLDGTNRLLQELAIKNQSKKEFANKFDEKESKSFLKLKEILISSSSYSLYGSSVFELEEISGISVPTINRFLEKYRKNLNKTRFVKRDYYRFE